MKRYIYVILALVVSFSACKKSKVEPEVNIDNVFGSWKMISFKEGWSGRTVIPVDDYVVEYNRDGSFKHYKNAAVLSQGNFTVQLDKTIFSQTPMYVIVQSINSAPGSRLAVFKAKKDTLDVAMDAYDAGGELYVKIK